MPVSILIVEDTADLLEAMKLVLRAAGFAVITAETGKSALQLLTNVRSGLIAPDVIVTDIRMPEMNGLELIRAIRAIPEFVKTPIIAMTGEDKIALVHAEEFGANVTLQKPLDPNVLIENINKLIKSKQA
ncbi:MAG TPA: response regulator [Blastocatellia bacterium]|nr:response regulator [Blastocatellia bacterium]